MSFLSSFVQSSTQKTFSVKVSGILPVTTRPRFGELEEIRVNKANNLRTIYLLTVLSGGRASRTRRTCPEGIV